MKQPRYFFDIEAIQPEYEKNPGDVVPNGASLVARCITAGCPSGGVLLDPFNDTDMAAAIGRAGTAA